MTTAFLPSYSTSIRALVRPNLLIVSDRHAHRAALQACLTSRGYKLKEAASVNEAVERVIEQHQPVDIILLEKDMTEMGGIELISRLKETSRTSNIPVIMMASSGTPELIKESLDADVYYYLTLPIDEIVLVSVIESAFRSRRQKILLSSELKRFNGALKIIDSCTLSVRTLADAENTSCLIASCFPKPELVVDGLMELTLNAVEHGNLAIPYEEKHQLLSENRWFEELNRRANLPENAAKTAQVIYQHKEEGYLVQISDCGPGFDWRRYWRINPARATSSHGRGIARARLMAFDRMAYNEAGNVVTVMVETKKAEALQGDYAW